MATPSRVAGVGPPESPPVRSPTGEAFLRTMERSVETVRRVFGESHSYYADALEHYAKGLLAVGEAEQALQVSRRAAAIRDVNQTRRAAWKAAGNGDSVAPRVLGAQGAASYLALGLDTLYRLVRSGELPHSRVGKSIRFRPEDLDEYLAARVTREWTRVDRRGRPKQRRES